MLARLCASLVAQRNRPHARHYSARACTAHRTHCYVRLECAFRAVPWREGAAGTSAGSLLVSHNLPCPALPCPALPCRPSVVVVSACKQLILPRRRRGREGRRAQGAEVSALLLRGLKRAGRAITRLFSPPHPPRSPPLSLFFHSQSLVDIDMPPRERQGREYGWVLRRGDIWCSPRRCTASLSSPGHVRAPSPPSPAPPCAPPQGRPSLQGLSVPCAFAWPGAVTAPSSRCLPSLAARSTLLQVS